MNDNNLITGLIHSTESCGTVDGPGIRFVVFTQGCPLRCLYCHNPDCRHIENGKKITVGELIEEIEKYHSYFDYSGGGVTVTGGEPLMQPEFVKAIFQECHKKRNSYGFGYFWICAVKSSQGSIRIGGFSVVGY